MNSVIDFHTHHSDAAAALIAVDPRHFDPQPGKWYSVGFHPWEHVEDLTGDDFALLEQCARHTQVLAVGETGIDRLRGGDLTTQEAVFIRHLRLARELGKPVVVHNVRATQDILAARHRAHLDGVTLAIHGMRSGANVARMLLRADCYLSYGPRFSPDALRITPMDRLLIETDEAPQSIDEVASLVAEALNMTASEVLAVTAANAHRLLFS